MGLEAYTVKLPWWARRPRHYHSLEKLDRIFRNTTTALRRHLLPHFGVTYRNYLHTVSLNLDGTAVDPVDPLFITPGYRLYDLDEDRADPRHPAEIWLTAKRTGEKAKITIRYARFPRTFFRVDKSKKGLESNTNERYPVMMNNFGIIVCRMGRQLDVLEKTPWPHLEKFRNNDRFWAAEIDFPAELDEEFTIANSKQGVVMSERLWDHLKDAGMESAIPGFRKEVDAEQAADRAKPEEENRASERSMEESRKFKRARADVDPVEREKRARDALEKHVRQKARATKRPECEVREEFEAEAASHPYRVQFEYMPGAPFYRVEQIGGMKVLFINRAHRFFSDVYAAPESTRGLCAALEVLLFVIGECELDAQGNKDRRMFYAVERQAWSEQLATALETLSQFIDRTEIVDDEEARPAAAE